MRIDRGAQLLVAVLGLGAGDADAQPDLREARPHLVRDAEEVAHVEVALRIDTDVVDLDAQRARIQPVDDDLAGDERPERELHRTGGYIVPGQCGRLVDEKAMLARGDRTRDRALAGAGDTVGERRTRWRRGDALGP